MMVKDLLGVFKKGFVIFRKPVFLIFGFILWACLFLLSKISMQINKIYTNTFFSISWLVIFSIITLLLVSFILSNIVMLSKRGGKIDGISGGKTWIRSFVILLIIALLTILLGRIAHYGGLFIGQIFGLEIGTAKLVFILIYFAGIIGFLIFLTFAMFFSIIENLGIKESIKKSARLVKNNYIETLGINLIMFVFFFLFYRLEGIVFDIIEYVILIPYFTNILTNFVLKIK